MFSVGVFDVVVRVVVVVVVVCVCCFKVVLFKVYDVCAV
jgi:hypothetical protein